MCGMVQHAADKVTCDLVVTTHLAMAAGAAQALAAGILRLLSDHHCVELLRERLCTRHMHRAGACNAMGLQSC